MNNKIYETPRISIYRFEAVEASVHTSIAGIADAETDYYTLFPETPDAVDARLTTVRNVIDYK